MSDAIIRLNAALTGRYEVERELGEGGMATVYLAKDLKHNRNVALKVLKPELAAVVGAERFLAEIETTANLQHPHILPLFDSGEADSFLFYVMPYVEGETLRERIDRELQLPVDEALGIVTSVASALQHAHERGVIHRDIKPGNILLQDGQPVVADFGIALAVGAAGGARLTETGLSVGTPYYMSPEQATGDQGVGPASDTYALACVLYELLVGEPPYPGKTAQAVLGKIIQGTPVSATAIRKSIPANVDAAIRKALEKIPADRFTGAAEFAKALADPAFRHGEMTETAAAAGLATWKRVSVLTGTLAAAFAAALGWSLLRSSPPDPVIRYVVTLSEEQAPAATGQGAFGTSLTLSDDGSRVVYVGTTGDGPSQLWLRERHQLESRPLPGTEDAHQPALSPAGTHVAYITAGATRELKTASLGGEPPLTLVGSDVFRLGLGWGLDGYVYFSQQPHGGLARVAETGGEVEQISTPDEAAGETRHAWPDVLPNGKGVLVTVQRGDNVLSSEDDVGVLDLASGEVRILFRGLLARYATSGHLVFVTHEGDLRAAPFDQGRLEVTGPAVPLLSGMPVADRGPDVALSRSGRLMYSPISLSGVQEVVWVDRNGSSAPVEGGWTLTPQPNSGPELSPDGRSIAIGITAPGGPEIWVKRIGGPFSRLAFESASQVPSWSPDGVSVIYSGSAGGNTDVLTKRADGSGNAEVLVDLADRSAYGARWSNDGNWVVFRTLAEPTRDILAVQPASGADPVSLVATDFEDAAPMLSPDGRFLAYMSSESGATEIYVRPFPNVNDARRQVSTDGGREPRWSHTGQELFYKNVFSELVSVTVSTESGFEVLERNALFTLPTGSSYNAVNTTYDITEDDQRFVMLRPVGVGNERQIGHFIVVENFLEELKQRIGN